MFKHIIRTSLCILTGLLLTSAAFETVNAAVSVEQRVKHADLYRLESSNAKVTTFVKLYEDQTLDKTRAYDVYLRSGRESLVLFKSPVEAGQKMLMLGDNYWLVMPKSRRPIRITPMQKLLGEASVGDISTLTWSDDYQASFVKTDSVEHDGKVIETHQIELVAKTSGASYQRIDLWLDRSNDFPVRADLYLRSGKLAKEAWFTPGQRDGELRVVVMTLLDRIQPSKTTVVEYKSIEPMTLDDKFYNPGYLTRNPDLGL